MIKSMTGYGSSKGTSGAIEITVEVKSVNNRYLDCSIKMPRVFNSIEDKLKTIIQGFISRGKVDVFLSVDTSNADDIEIKINRPLARAYVSALKMIAQENDLGGEVLVSDIIRFSDILHVEKSELDTEEIFADISSVLKSALYDFNDMRVREGKRLEDDISARLDEIERLEKRVIELSPRTVEEYRKRLETRMCDVLQTVGIDELRILTEAALFAERVAINEEVVRLKSHISQLRKLLSKDEPIGRKIDFLVQEFNREANTIGSKCNDSEMSIIIVDMKAEIEKIREQAQNIE